MTDYFSKVLEDNLKAVGKRQYVDQIPKAVKGPTKQVGKLIEQRAQTQNLDEILEVLGMQHCYQFYQQADFIRTQASL